MPSLQLRRYTSERGGYSILMPGGVNPGATPVFQSSVTRYAESVVLPNGGGVFEVSYGDRPLAANPDAELRAYWQAWAERGQLSVTSTKPMEKGGNSILDIRFVSARGPFPAGRLRLTLIKRGEGHRLYAILRAGPAKCDEGGEVETFFDYFRDSLRRYNMPDLVH